MNSLLRRVTSATNKKDSVVRESLQRQLNESVVDLQGAVEIFEKGPVGHCDETNTLCCVVEAIFLHGLKDSFLIRVTEALSGPDCYDMPQPSFWAPLLVFSHRQIIDQIQSLTQLTSEVGYSRAWIRLVLNEGLLSSYLSVIKRENSALKPYYDRNAFIRDPDLVEVARRLIESIDHVQFNLVCNSSLLNYWGITPLLMAAIWAPSINNPMVATAVDIAKTINSDVSSNENLDEVETTSSIGSLGSRNSSMSALNNIAGLSEDEALKVILSKGKKKSSKVSEQLPGPEVPETKKRDDGDGRESTGRNAELRNAGDGRESTSTETEEVQERRGAKKEHLKIDIKNQEPATKSSNENEVLEPSGDAATAAVGNSLLGRLGWSTSFEDCESSMTSSVTSHASGTGGPRTPVDSRPYDVLIQSYHTAGYATTPDLREFLNGYPRRESVRNDSLVEIDPEEIQEVVTRSLDHQLGKISVEKGLDSQNYSCLSCGQPIGMTFAKAHVCAFTGEYYCTKCMADKEFLIPARVIHNWDLKCYPVSQRVARYLSENPPLLDLKILNPRIYKAVDDMAQLQSLRIQLNLLRAYLFTCREPIIESLQKKVAPREYLYEHVHRYSVSDLGDIPDGIMAQQLQKIIAFAKGHVINCWLCSQKGFICEVCKDPGVIYPFDVESTYRCADCNSVFHAECLNASMPCPKWKRMQKRLDILDFVDLENAEPATTFPPSTTIVSK